MNTVEPVKTDNSREELNFRSYVGVRLVEVSLKRNPPLSRRGVSLMGCPSFDLWPSLIFLPILLYLIYWIFIDLLSNR